MQLPTKNLILRLLTTEETLAMIEAMNPEDRAKISADWLAQLRTSTADAYWTHGFSLVLRETGVTIGSCAFKGPPDADGAVEIAYGIDPEYQGRGYATEAAQALTDFAFTSEGVHLVRAHTLPETNASTHVLTKCGFHYVGEVIDPDDGLVWRWEKRRSKTKQTGK